jgi:hypothetical protein
MARLRTGTFVVVGRWLLNFPRTLQRLPTTRLVAAVLVIVGILAQSGGFFIQLVIGQLGARTTITGLGAALLVLSIVILVYGLITTK